jgi:hypothetical protein
MQELEIAAKALAARATENVVFAQNAMRGVQMEPSPVKGGAPPGVPIAQN